MDARYIFHLSPPRDAVSARPARKIPGVIVRRLGAILDVPHNAGWIVAALCEKMGWEYDLDVSPQADTPRADTPTEAHAWLWHNTPPTTGEPIRLLPYQRESIAQLLRQSGGHLWAPPGAGKTVTAHTWALTITTGPIVIVTRSDARETHRRELVRCSSCEPFAWKPASSVRKRDRWPNVYAYLTEAYAQKFRPVVIVGWDMLPTITPILIANVAPSAVIFDESHRAKSTKRHKWALDENGRLKGTALATVSMAAYQLAVAADYRLTTTATAIRHRTWDLWGQLTLAEPMAWGKTVSKFAFRYCDAKPGEYGGLDMSGQSNTDELKARLTFSVSRVPYDVLAAQLPQKRRQVIRVPPERQVKALARSKEIAADLRRVKAQAVSGNGKAGYRLNESRIEDAASSKRSVVPVYVRDYLQTGRGKILVLTGRRRDCEALGERVGKLPATVWWAHGGDWGGNDAAIASLEGVDTSTGPRMAIQDAYMAHPGPCCIVGTIDAWGESRNLQDTDVLLCVQLPYTPGKIDQLEGRVQRLGMDRPVLIVYLVAEDTIDERVAALMLDKLPAVADVVGGGALEGLDTSLKGLDDREAVLASLAGMFGPLEDHNG